MVSKGGANLTPLANNGNKRGCVCNPYIPSIKHSWDILFLEVS